VFLSLVSDSLLPVFRSGDYVGLLFQKMRNSAPYNINLKIWIAGKFWEKELNREFTSK